jgi:hypothetical protein
MPLEVNAPPPYRRWVVLAWIVVAALPVLYILGKVVAASRNIVFWDEFDTALDLILRINAGADWHEILQRFFAINNEHRTVMSRLLFAGSYWLTGTINFHVIGAIGNLFMVGACATLILAVKTWERRVRMGVILAFLMYQLEHFESFVWSGSSIDHFQVLMLGVIAIAALARATRRSCVGGGVAAVLATFTLAQGVAVWPAGALLLAHQRRWRELIGWCVAAALVMTAFLHGFAFNPGHHISEVTSGRIGHVVTYWIALLGGPLTLGDAAFAAWPGVLLLAGFGLLAAKGTMTREPLAFFSGVFAIGALALIAFGRSEIAGTEINSRYLVLGALAWAMLIFMLIELRSRPEHPFRWLLIVLPALAAFTLAADLRFAPMIESFVEVRDRAATSFQQYGEDGHGITRLHPRDRHADILLKMAADRGVYQLPRFSKPVTLPAPMLNPRIVTYVDELVANERAVTIGGWAMLPGEESKRGEVHVVLRSAQSQLIFTSVTLQRTDVAQAYKEPKWRLCGFRAVIGRKDLPAQNFEIGVLITGHGVPQYQMTVNRLELASAEAKVVRAPLP